MAKNFGKFVLFSLFAGAAAAGTYYFLKNRGEEDRFEDSEPDVNDELEDFLKKESESGPDISGREYVPLNFSREAVMDAEDESTPGEKPVDRADPVKKTEPAEAEPVKAEPVIAEPAEAEPIKNDAIKSESGNLAFEKDEIENPLKDTAEKVSAEEENIIGKPLEEVKKTVEKASDEVNSRVSTFSFSSF